MKELAAETLMVGNVDSDLKKKIAVDLRDKEDMFLSMCNMCVRFYQMLVFSSRNGLTQVNISED